MPEQPRIASRGWLLLHCPRCLETRRFYLLTDTTILICDRCTYEKTLRTK